jgi:DNA adenine methylase
LKPVLRWAGGKTHLVGRLARLMPAHYERYFEPMVGAGALFFQLCPARAVLADINEELILFYKTLRDQRDALISALASLEASRETYYDLRDRNPTADLDRAIRFVYLNRLCWNGIYRVNRRGEFNVPIGDRLPSTLWKDEHLRRASAALEAATLVCADFRETLADVREGDFVYLDPPYPRGSKNGFGFARYSVGGFGESHHQALADEIETLSKRNVHVMLTLAHAPFVDAVYPKSLSRISIASKSLMSGRTSGRRKVTEIVLTNYEHAGLEEE